MMVTLSRRIMVVALIITLMAIGLLAGSGWLAPPVIRGAPTSRSETRMFEVPQQVTIPIGAAGQYFIYQCPANKRVRLLILHVARPAGTFNVDQFLVWAGNDENAIYLDGVFNKATGAIVYLGHLNAWMNPSEELQIQITNFTVAGWIQVRMWIEIVSREEDPQSVSIKESVEIDTRPFGRLFR